MPTVTIIIPVFNEAATVVELVERVLAAPLDKQIVIVNDGSTDGTRELLESHFARGGNALVEVHSHPRNRGKGAAVRTGLAHARGDYVVVQDADLEYDPGEIALVVRPLIEGKARAVYGSRYLRRSPFSLAGAGNGWSVFSLGVMVLNWVVRLLYGVRLTDEATCYKAMSTDLMRKLQLQCDGFDFCAEVTAKLCRLGVPIVETPISYRPRSRREGKKIRLTDGFGAVRTLWKHRSWSSDQALGKFIACGTPGRDAPIPAPRLLMCLEHDLGIVKPSGEEQWKGRVLR